MFLLGRVPHALLVATLLLTACGTNGANNASTPPPEPLNLRATAAPIELGSLAAEYYEAIEYGPYEEDLFHIYLPESDQPTPSLIYIHGGGFTGGWRDTSGSEEQVRSYLAQGVAYASIDYRLLKSPDPDSVIKSLQGSTRCLQFIRYHAQQLNIDPSNEDPVLRQTTGVTALIAIATQATYDIGKWTTVVFEEYRLNLLELADALSWAQALLDFYGITDVDDFESPEIVEYRARVDMLGLMDAEDPPF